MEKRFFSPIIIFVILFSLFLILTQSLVNAQFKVKDDFFHLSGTIENDKTMSGFFSKNRNDLKNKNWCVFVGANGKIYRLSLIDKSIRDLYIDGQKIEDSQIWKHTAEYKPFLLKFWRDQELEAEDERLDLEEKPLDQKVEELDKQIEKLEVELEKLEEKAEKGSANFVDNRKKIKEQIKQLEQQQQEFEQKLDELSNLQDKFGEEQDALNLFGETEKVLQQIAEDLKSLGAVKTTHNLSFKLSNLELIVNGKKASPEMFDLLKNRYLFPSDGETGFLYRWKGKV